MLLVWTPRHLLCDQPDCVASSRHGAYRWTNCPRGSHSSTPSFYSETNSGSSVLRSECKRHCECGPVERSPVLVSWPRALIPTPVALLRLIEVITERTNRKAVCPDNYEYDSTTEVMSAHGRIGSLFRARRCGSS